MSKKVELDKLEEMFSTWANLHSIRGTAKECGVAAETVRKYVEFGDPERGIEAFRDRYAKTIKRVTELTDESIATSFAERAKAVVPYLEGLERLIHQGIAALDGKQASRVPTLDRIAKAVSIAAEARRQLWEDGREIEDVSSKVPLARMVEEIQSVIARLTDEEYRALKAGIESYQETGKMPSDVEAILLGEEVRH